MELLGAILAEEPDSISHWNLKAATHARLGDFEEAIELYEEVLTKFAANLDEESRAAIAPAMSAIAAQLWCR